MFGLIFDRSLTAINGKFPSAIATSTKGVGLDSFAMRQ